MRRPPTFEQHAPVHHTMQPCIMAHHSIRSRSTNQPHQVTEVRLLPAAAVPPRFSPIASLIRPNAVHRYLGTCHHGVLRSWKQLIGFVFSLCRLTGGIIITVVITGTPFQSALGTLSATILGAIHARAHRHHGRYQQKRMAGNTMVGPVR